MYQRVTLLLKGAPISEKSLISRRIVKKRNKERRNEERVLSDDMERKENTNDWLFICNLLKHESNMKLNRFDIILNESFIVSIENYLIYGT